MFELGRDYEMHFVDGGNEAQSTFTVVDWQPPLLKLRQPDMPDTIFNTNSTHFIRASLSRHDRGTAKHSATISPLRV